MKKTILAMIVAGSSVAVCAQDTTNMNNNRTDSAQNMTGNQTSTGNYNAYANMPPMIQKNFQAQYPGATNAQWQPTYNGFWRASVMQNGQPINVYYAKNGESFTVALPVLQSSVPADIMSRAMDLYGANVYDISLVKLPNPQLAAMDSMMAAAVANPNNNAGVMGTDSSSMGNTTGDSSMAMTHTYWGVDTTGRAAMPRTIDLYLVRIIDNGMLRAQRMNADGTPDLSYGTTMASPMPSNMNVSNNMDQNLTTTNVNMTTNPPTYSAYYNSGTTGVSTNVSTNAYPAKDSAANMNMNTNIDSTRNVNTDTTSMNTDTTARMDTSAAAPITDTTSRATVDTTASSTTTDTSSGTVTDTTSNSSGVNSTNNMNNNNTQIQNESGNVNTTTNSATGTDVNNNMNTNKKNKKNKKNKTNTNGTTTPSGTSGY